MRTVLALTALALGLCACAPDSDRESGSPSPLPGYELASAKAVETSKSSPEVIDVSVDELVKPEQ